MRRHLCPAWRLQRQLHAVPTGSAIRRHAIPARLTENGARSESPTRIQAAERYAPREYQASTQAAGGGVKCQSTTRTARMLQQESESLEEVV